MYYVTITAKRKNAKGILRQSLNCITWLLNMRNGYII